MRAAAKQRIFRALGTPRNVWPPFTFPILSLNGESVPDITVVNWSIDGDSLSGDRDATMYCADCDATVLVHGVIAAGEIHCAHGIWQRAE